MRWCRRQRRSLSSSTRKTRSLNRIHETSNRLPARRGSEFSSSMQAMTAISTVHLQLWSSRKPGRLLVQSDPFFNSQPDKIVALAARYAIPSIYQWRDFPAAGGLMSYGTVLADAYRLVGVYTGKILKGAKPTDLPVQQSVKVLLVINLKTAKALGLTIPPSVLARADEVIE